MEFLPANDPQTSRTLVVSTVETWHSRESRLNVERRRARLAKQKINVQNAKGNYEAAGFFLRNNY
jgi:hypothetical protein